MEADPQNIRNFSIIAHIDHGKSTLADRLMLRLGAINARDFRNQLLDDMDLERERGITIKSSAVTLTAEIDGRQFMFNLIDTPGHVDFHYEVSRALQACDGAILVVDAAQGVEAQTVANAYLAVEGGLEIISAVNKVDLPGARPEDVAMEIEHLLGDPAEEAIQCSAKSGVGIDQLIDAIVHRLPPPAGDAAAATRALIFDSKYNDYRGVVVYVRVVDGELAIGDRIRMMGKGGVFQISELGKHTPNPTAVKHLRAGEVGYVVANIRALSEVHIGDTITRDANRAAEALPGYQAPQKMVFSDFYCGPTTQYPQLREALQRLQLNDAALTFQPTSGEALGFGFRCGFLGLLHMEIVQ